MTSEQTLFEREAWTLFQCLHLQINISDSFSYKRLHHALDRSYLRWSRRQSKLFNYQSGDLCRFPVQSPDALGQGSTNHFINHDFVTHEQQITGDIELTQQIESEPKNGLEIIPHIPRMGGLRKKAVLVNRDVKESPLSITSGLL